MLGVRALAHDRLVLTGVDATVAFCLRQVPAILAHRDADWMRERMYPDAVPHDAARAAEWRRLTQPELRQLFEAAQHTLEADLAAFEPRRGRVEFPASHLKAWMNAVNQARVVLTEQHQFDARDMQRAEFDAASSRDAALLQIQVLGYLLQVLVEHALEGA